MTKDIYDQHRDAFNRVSAFVVMRGAECVATVAIKFPSDQSLRMTAFVHWRGLTMVKASVGGYGYDKRSAAVAKAIESYPTDAMPSNAFDAFRATVPAMDSDDWTRALEKAGFNVIQAV